MEQLVSKPTDPLIDEIQQAITKHYEFMTIEMSYARWLAFSAMYPAVYYTELSNEKLADSFDFVTKRIALRDECRQKGGFYTVARQWVNVNCS